MTKEILIVDDEADIRMLTAGILEDEGYQTRQADGSESALDSVENRRPDLVLLDIWLQGSKLDGLQILRRIKKHHTEIPVLMMSGHGTVETAVAAIKDGAYDFIEKPFKTDRLLLVVDHGGCLFSQHHRHRNFHPMRRAVIPSGRAPPGPRKLSNVVVAC